MGSQVNPPAAAGRIHVIDAIRGLAVFGILVANIQNWSGYKFVTLTEIELLPLSDWDATFSALHYWLVDGKFYAIFSLLFGAGFGLQFIRKQDQLDTFLPIYRRRLAFLFLFGVLHALFWSGDILTLYALLAFVLVAMRNIPERQLLWVALGMLAIFAVPQTLMMLSGHSSPAVEKIAHVNYVDLTPAELRAALGEGNWREVFSVNLHNLYWRWVNFIPNGRFSRVLGLFLLGFYLARSGFFTTAIYRSRVLGGSLVLGLGLTAIARLTGTGMSRWAESGSEVVLKVVLVAGQVLLAIAYMSMLARVFRTPSGERLLYPLTLIGRVAFTSYLSQSLIGVLFFYGVGLGFWGTMGLAQLWGLAVVIYAGQVAFASAWLHFFRQGPVEWLWACLTAGRMKPNLR